MQKVEDKLGYNYYHLLLAEDNEDLPIQDRETLALNVDGIQLEFITVALGLPHRDVEAEKIVCSYHLAMTPCYHLSLQSMPWYFLMDVDCFRIQPLLVELGSDLE